MRSVVCSLPKIPHSSLNFNSESGPLAGSQLSWVIPEEGQAIILNFTVEMEGLIECIFYLFTGERLMCFHGDGGDKQVSWQSELVTGMLDASRWYPQLVNLCFIQQNNDPAVAFVCFSPRFHTYCIVPNRCGGHRGTKQALNRVWFKQNLQSNSWIPWLPMLKIWLRSIK